MPKMISGEWAGTMCLTEPHCGTDLRLMKTRAVEQPDGTYRMTGTKIFISGGDHDLTDNIIHMVIAKIPDEDGKIARRSFHRELLHGAEIPGRAKTARWARATPSPPAASKRRWASRRMPPAC